MIYFLMKEAITTMNRPKNINTKETGEIKENRRNKIVHVYDGLERRLANTVNAPTTNFGARTISVLSIRDYFLVVNNLLPGMTPKNNENNVAQTTILNFDDVITEDEEKESTSEDEEEEDEEMNEKKPKKKNKIKNIKEPQLPARTRNNYKLFSKSPRSIWVLYEQAFKRFAQFCQSCTSEWKLDSHNDRLVLRHNARQVIANNLAALLNSSFSISTENKHTTSSLLNDLDVASTNIRVVRTSKLITSAAENAVLSSDCNWNLNNIFTVDLPTEHTNDLTSETQDLLSRLVELRHRVKVFVNEREPHSDPYEGAGDDEHLVQRLHRLAHSDRKPTEFRIEHEQEYSLVHLRNMTEQCVHIAHSHAIHILDFVFFSEFDAWDFFNQVLEYGIQAFRENGVYPIKHSLWDIILLTKKQHRFATRITDTLSLENYRTVWLYSSTTVVGGLTLFAQTFRQILRTCLCTSCSYFLNRKVMNTRKNGTKHDCVMPKTSQGTYYAMFLRLQAGHELICTDKIENDTEAINWFKKYDSINNHLWRRRRITRCLLLNEHLAEASEEAGNGGDGLRVQTTQKNSVEPIPTYDYTKLIERCNKRPRLENNEDSQEEDEYTATEDDDTLSLLDYNFDDE